MPPPVPRLWRCPSFARLSCQTCTSGEYRDHCKPGRERNGDIETVSRMARTGSIIALALGLALSVLADARSQTVETPYIPRAMATNGAVVVMPEIAGLDCAEMAQVLRRIDLSKYRAAGPIHVGHPDWLIFEYEDTLAARYYTECIMAASRLADPGPAFSFGFESQ